jgi:hypothetical protein
VKLEKAGIPDFIIGPYRIGAYILKAHTWSFVQPQRDGRPVGQSAVPDRLFVQQEGDEFFFVRGHTLADLEHDLIVFLYPYYQVQVAPSVYDEFAQKRDPLPRWTRTRWLGMERVKGSLRNGLLNIPAYDFRADRRVSTTCRGIKKITRLLAHQECNFSGSEEAHRQIGWG